MAKVKSYFHGEIERQRCIENERCGQCGEDMDLGTEAAKAGQCRQCWNETNGRFGLGA